jgi:hypothetical protein
VSDHLVFWMRNNAMPEYEYTEFAVPSRYIRWRDSRRAMKTKKRQRKTVR